MLKIDYLTVILMHKIKGIYHLSSISKLLSPFFFSSALTNIWVWVRSEINGF